MTTHAVLFLLASACLAGCSSDSSAPKTPPADAPTPGGQAPTAGQPAAGQPGAGVPAPGLAPESKPVVSPDDPNFVPNAGQGAEQPKDAPGPAKLVAPQKTQEQVKQGAFFEVSGSVSGACEGGTLRVDALDVAQLPGDGPRDEVVPGPLTAVELDAPGPFSLAIPEGVTAELAVLCDADKNGVIDGDKDKLAKGDRQVHGAVGDYTFGL